MPASYAISEVRAIATTSRGTDISCRNYFVIFDYNGTIKLAQTRAALRNCLGNIKIIIDFVTSFHMYASRLSKKIDKIKICGFMSKKKCTDIFTSKYARYVIKILAVCNYHISPCISCNCSCGKLCSHPSGSYIT